MPILKNRNFFILFAGQLVSQFGNYLYMIALPWYILSITNSRTDLVLTGIVQNIPAIAGLFVGVYVDRWKKKNTMLAIDLIRFFIASFLFILTAWGILSMYSFIWLLVLVLCLEFVGQMFSPAQKALLPKIVPSEQLTEAMGVNHSGSSTAGLLGMFGGGFLISVLGAPLLFLFNAITFLVSSISFLFVRVNEDAADLDRKHTFWSQWRDGFRVIIKTNAILRICIMAFIANFALSAVDIVLAAWVKGPMNGSGYMLGLITGTFMVGSIIGGLALGRIAKHISQRHLLLFGGLCSGLLVGLNGLFPLVFWNTVVMLLNGFSIAVLNGTIGATAIKVVPEAMRGRVFATTAALSTLSLPLGVGLFGFLMLHLPLPYVFSIIGLFVIAGSLLFLGPFEGEKVLTNSTKTMKAT